MLDPFKFAPPILYVASPYEHEDLFIRVERFRAVKCIVAEIIQYGRVIPYSPIAYTHPLVDLMPKDFDWVKWDFGMLNQSIAMGIAKIPGWEISKGIKKEIDHCLGNKIPHFYMNPENPIRSLIDFLKSFNANQIRQGLPVIP